MEKTNSNIPTPEELKAYIDESVISVTGTYDQSASVLMVDDFTIGTLGNFSASNRESQKQENLQCLGHSCSRSDKWHGAHYRACFPEGKGKFSTLTRNRARTIARKFSTES